MPQHEGCHHDKYHSMWNESGIFFKTSKERVYSRASSSVRLAHNTVQTLRCLSGSVLTVFTMLICQCLPVRPMGVSSFLIHLQANTSVWTTDINDSSVNYCQDFNWLKMYWQTIGHEDQHIRKYFVTFNKYLLIKYFKKYKQHTVRLNHKRYRTQDTSYDVIKAAVHKKSEKSKMQQSKEKGGLERLAANRCNTKGIRQQKQETRDGKMWQGQEWGGNTGFNTQGWIN